MPVAERAPEYLPVIARRKTKINKINENVFVKVRFPIYFSSPPAAEEAKCTKIFEIIAQATGLKKFFKTVKNYRKNRSSQFDWIYLLSHNEIRTFGEHHWIVHQI